jgi:hypothetical protein
MVLEIAPGLYNLMVRWGLPGRPHGYSRLELDATGVSVVQELEATDVVRVSSRLQRVSTVGDQVVVDLEAIRCGLQSQYQIVPISCQGDSEIPPGIYDLKVEDLPADVYLVSATADGSDMFTGARELRNGPVQVDIVIAGPGATVEGTVRAPSDAVVPNATVVLVPASPLPAGDSRYRVAVTDVNGHFELRGIAPVGAYRLFAWEGDLNGAAYRNAQFMEQFEGSGLELNIDTAEHQSVEITTARMRSRDEIVN